MLAFEPPHYGSAGARATIGGTIACGFSGPRRPYAGAARDFVLGVRIVNGKGEDLAFGGRVIKNVAGYDVSRLLAGSLGTLGVIAEASVKVLPRPPAERTLRFDMDVTAALDAMNVWAGEALPISATAWHDGVLYVRLAGSAAAVQAATPRLGGTEAGDSSAFWRAIREQTHAFFAGDEPLWRVAVPSAAAPLGLPGAQLLEWNGGLRWLRWRASAEEIRAAAKRAGGHATLFRARDKSAGAFTPLDPLLLRLHRALKGEFDPAGILNPGRMYAEF
jgi:glycolate oxidase FAD binding subunit